MKCKNCGADLKLDAKRKITYCPFCGSKDPITESDDVFIARMKNDLALERLKLEKKRLKTRFSDLTEDTQAIIVYFLAMFVLFGGIALFGMNSEKDSRHTPADMRSYLNRPYQEVAQELTDAGFSAVSTSAMGDLADWLFFSKQGDVGKVGRVTIKGAADFKKGDSFQKDDPVIVYYHSYPDSNGN